MNERSLKEAMRYVEWFRRREVGLELDVEAAIDFSDVQELRVKIWREHGSR